MDDISRYYEILGLKVVASEDEIKQAYRDLVKVWHPDRFAHDPPLQKKADETLKKINEAYQKILDYINKPHEEFSESDTEEQFERSEKSFKSDSTQFRESESENYSDSQPPPESPDTEIFTKANNISEKQNISDWGLPFAFTIFGFSAGLQTRGGIVFVIFGGVIFYFIGKKIVNIINDIYIPRGKKIVWAWITGIIAFPLAIIIGVAIREEILR